MITSDHGECFGEVSHFDPTFRTPLHGPEGGIHECQAHVPLLVKPPGDSYTPDRVSKAASLTEFPTSVRDALAGDLSRESFVPDDRVLVTMSQQHEPTCLAVYENEGERIRTVSKWGSTIVEGHVHDAQTNYIGAATVDIDIGAIDRQLSDQKVCSDRTETMSDEVKQRLGDLGYR